MAVRKSPRPQAGGLVLRVARSIKLRSDAPAPACCHHKLVLADHASAKYRAGRSRLSVAIGRSRYRPAREALLQPDESARIGNTEDLLARSQIGLDDPIQNVGHGVLHLLDAAAESGDG